MNVVRKLKYPPHPMSKAGKELARRQKLLLEMETEKMAKEGPKKEEDEEDVAVEALKLNRSNCR